MYTTGGRHRYLPLGTQSSAARHRKWKKEKGFHDMGKDLPTNFCIATGTYIIHTLGSIPKAIIFQDIHCTDGQIAIL